MRRKSKILNHKSEIIKTIRYFSFFNYPPSFEEIYTFLPKKTSKKKLNEELELVVSEKKVLRFMFYDPRYTLLEYSLKQFQNWEERQKISQKKLRNWRIRMYFKLLSLFPQIKLIGLSGSIAMMNAGEKDDIDLFIITAKNRLFTGRFITIILAKLLGIHRKRVENIKNIRSTFHVLRYTNKVCLNLFFDESNLEVPDFKKTKYVAHEILQMKPVIVKGDIYQRFLKANSWVFEIFPNGKRKSEIRNSNFETDNKLQTTNFKYLRLGIWNLFRLSTLMSRIFSAIELLLKKFQLSFINRHRTSEIITSTQLWFHPTDFEAKIRPPFNRVG